MATASLDCNLDNDTTTQDEIEGNEGNQAVSGHAVVPDRLGSILSSVDKVLSY
jgi:hypothetical protein